jgi:preprotein translocase subunit SecF
MLFDIVGRRYLFFALSLVILVPGLIALTVWGLRPGIDFTGGTLWELIPKASGQVDPSQVRATLQAAGQPAAQVILAELRSGAQVTPTLQIRMPNISTEQKMHLEDTLVRAEVVAGTLTTSPGGGEGPRLPAGRAAPEEAEEPAARGQFAPGQEVQFTTVGPVVGRQVTNNAILVVAAAAGGILLYLWWAFRHVPGALRYGVAAVLALLHDVLVVLGIFAILGQLFGVEIDVLFVTALLTIIGFSVHDSIVVFDRIRENQLQHRFESFAAVVNYSLLQTLARSITTSLTVVFTLLALYLFGGVTIHNFILALLLGIVSGTYSSIFNASLLLVVWEAQDWRHGWWRNARAGAPGAS